MHEVFKIFVLSTLIVNLWTVFLLLQDKRGNKLLNRWFAAFLVALSLPQMDLYVNQVVPGGVFKLAILASTFLWLKGPFIWVFVKVLARKETNFRSIGLHFVPWFCALAFLFSSPKLVLPFMLAGMCHMVGYLLFSLWRLVKMRSYLASLWQGFPNSAYYWLLYVIGGAMALVAVDLMAMSLVLTQVLSTYDALDYFAFPLFSVYVLSVGILSVYRPELLFREAPETASVNSTEEIIDTSLIVQAYQQNDHKERHLELNISIAQSLIQQLTQLMQERQVYLQNELSLADLAAYLGISVNQVSELLNVHAGLSFSDYVNGYRLKHACDLLANPQCHLRVLDIAFEAGYNNKNSFYRAFKDNLGVTPNQYRAKMLAVGAGEIA